MPGMDETVAALPPLDRLHLSLPFHVGTFADGWFDAVVMRTAEGVVQVAVTFDWVAVSGKGATYSDAYDALVKEVWDSYNAGDFDTRPTMMTEDEMLAAAFEVPDFVDREDFTIEATDLNPATSFLGDPELFLA